MALSHTCINCIDLSLQKYRHIQHDFGTFRYFQTICLACHTQYCRQTIRIYASKWIYVVYFFTNQTMSAQQNLFEFAAIVFGEVLAAVAVKSSRLSYYSLDRCHPNWAGLYFKKCTDVCNSVFTK